MEKVEAIIYETLGWRYTIKLGFASVGAWELDPREAVSEEDIPRSFRIRTRPAAMVCR